MIPEEVRRLVEDRQRARRAKDFGLADELRDRIREAGFDVVDAPSGPQVNPIAPPPPSERSPAFRSGEEVPSVLDAPPTVEFSVQWIVQGWPDDVRRGIDSFRRFQGQAEVQHVVVEAPEQGEWPDDVDVVRMASGSGWATARNAGFRRCAGRIVVMVDGSIEATGDVLGRVGEALADPGVGLTGPFGIVSDDLREFRDSEGPDVDAVEGYLMAFRRELLEGGLRFDEKFAFYRTADIELSFQIKAMGLRATVTPLPVTRHEHRMWAATPEDERSRLSKRNFYRFLDRWRGRTDLLVANQPR